MNCCTHFTKLLFSRNIIMILLVLLLEWGRTISVADASSYKQINSDIPRFEEEKCSKIFPDMFPWYSLDSYNKNRFRCGYLITWENYDDQDPNRVIHLAVMETYTTQEPKPAPVIWLAGGPGGSGFTLNPKKAKEFTNLIDRGYIQFSQRGSHRSSIKSQQIELYCEEYHKEITNNWEKQMNWEEWIPIRYKALSDCHERLKAQNAIENFANINSKFNALDVIYLIRTLGYGNGNANLYGGSYGSLLAQHVIALSPGDVHSVVLEGVAPLGVDWDAEYPINIYNSLHEIFNECTKASSCRDTYPDLADSFYELLIQLENDPITISLKEGNKTYDEVSLDNYGFLLALGRSLSESDNLDKIPRIIYETSEAYRAGERNFGEMRSFGEKYYEYERNTKWPWGMYYSIYCTEFAQFNPGNTDLSQAGPQLQTLSESYEQLINKVCPLFGRNEYSYGDITISANHPPVLIFNGKFDPLTPPRYGDQVAKALSISDNFKFTSNTSAHKSINSDCAYRIMRNFFEKPTEPPDKDSCWTNELQSVKFEIPSSDEESPSGEEQEQKIIDTFNNLVQDLKTWWQGTEIFKAYQDLLSWITETRDNIDQTIKELEEFLQNIQDPSWWAQKTAELILQLCGLAFVPATVMLIQPIQRNRNKLKKKKRSY